ncbi:hypothetical protein B0T18DRAFT_492746 [Schizothecium vesticola]|uniref:DUF676 domain-containing protein n=1 Tax=Schizothecium vesticola TaxID=314040 RepID=A0AA40BR61_9PEZI|nr:hypothetical protein B0T18DRAFT_492746 [Schizothecium vesticola]
MTSWWKRQHKDVGDVDQADDGGGGPAEMPLGLFVLYPPETFRRKESELGADIVAVHGLNGTAKNTWTHRPSGKCWLESFLPDALPNARIMTFGYHSGLAFSKSRGGIETYARDLLNRLNIVRGDSQAQHRPLVFIAHSLGGIVVKKALVIAHESSQHVYGNILRSTKGIIFMGTPHRGGSDLVPWAVLLANLVNVATLGQAVRKDLLKSLKGDSAVLQEISRQFVHRATPLQIRSFIEQEVERPLKTLVVPEASATLGLPNEVIVPLNASHRSMCRFPSNTSQDYLLVQWAVMNILSGGGTQQPPIVVESGLAVTASNQNHQRDRERVALHTDERSDHSFRPGSTVASPTTDDFAASPPGIRSTDMITVKFNIRRHGSARGQNYQTSTVVPSSTLVSELRENFVRENHDLADTDDTYHEYQAFGHKIQRTWLDVFTTPVTVTTGRPCYDEAQGLRIHQEQTIASFFSKVFRTQVRVDLSRFRRLEEGSPFSDVASTSLSVCQGGEAYDMLISFMRTVRIPEDGKTYELPPSLGEFPLFDVRPFTELLPASMATQGGVFLPMYQLEAMWINFQCHRGKRFVVRPYLGGVNGITGEHVLGDMGSLLRKMNKLAKDQDYIVLPNQKWLDGVSTAPGIVKQFVATETALPCRAESTPTTLHQREPAAFSTQSRQDSGIGEPESVGASIEWQVTGHDSVGVIQLQIIPEFDVANISAVSLKDTCISSPGGAKLESYDETRETPAQLYDVLKTPKELGLPVGSVLHLRDLETRQRSRPKTVADLIQENPAHLEGETSKEQEIEIMCLSPPPVIEFAVVTLAGKRLTMRVPVTTLVQDIKQMIRGEGAIPPDKEGRLLYR